MAAKILLNSARTYRPLLSWLLVSLLTLPAMAWIEKLDERMKEIEKKYPDQVGLYVKDLKTGKEYSYKGDEMWYIASGVKLPIALETLRQVDLQNQSLQTQITLSDADYVDGAGQTNFQKAGTSLSVQYLIEQMMIYSDNTASDLLIKQVGLEPINSNLHRLVPVGFTPITTLADVRRYTYGEIHPTALQLSGKDFILLKSLSSDEERLQRLSSMLKLKETDLHKKTLQDAYTTYYAKSLNSATLRSYGELLGSIAYGKALQASSTEFLVQTMLKVETGKNRLRAGLPRSYHFAHKTGTQRERICDFGMAWPKSGKIADAVVIAACVRNFKSLKSAESALKQVGQALHLSGAL